MKQVLIILFITLGATANSQDHVDIFQSYYRISPQNKSAWNSNITYEQFGGEIKVPIVLKNEDVLIFGLEYNNHIFRSSSLGSSTGVPITKQYLHEAKMIAGIKHIWNDKWNTLAFYVPKLTGDYDPISKKGYQNGGLILNSYSKSDNLDLKFGAYVNAEEFGTMIVPLLGWNWKINDNWRFKGMIPVSLEVTYSRPKSNYGFLFIGKNASFYRENGAGSPTYMDMADNNAWGYAEFNIAKNWLIHFRAGHSVIRKFRAFDENDKLGLKIGPVNVGDDRLKFDPMFKDGFSFESRLIFRLPTN